MILLAPLSSTPLNSRLLSGASVLAIALAVGLVAPTGALAQTAAVNNTTYQTGTDDPDIDAGFQEAAAGDATITIDILNTDDTTLTLVNDDTVGTDQTLTVRVIDSSADSTADTLTITGDAVASNGGTIAIQVGEGTNQPVNLAIQGNVTETADGDTVTIQLGNSGGNQAVGLLFDASGAMQTVNSAISVVDASDNITVSVANAAGVASTTTFTDTVTLGFGDTIAIGGAVDTTAVFQADVTAPGGITVDATNADAALVLGASGATTTVTGNIDSVNATNNTSLSIADGANVRVIGSVFSTAAWTGGLTVGGGTTVTTFTLQGTLADETNVTLNDMATFVVDSTTGPQAVNSTIAAAANATTTVRTTGANGVSFNVGAVVGAVEAISTLDIDTNTLFFDDVSGGALDVADTFTATLDGTANAITGDITGAGTLALGSNDTLTLGANGATSTVSIANLGGSSAVQGNIAFAAGSMVTINSTIGSAGAHSIANFTLDDANTTVTINSTDTEAVTGDGDLTLGAGTLILGSNIGAGDTVFEFTSENGLITTANDTLSVQVAVNFTTGEIILADTNFDQSAAHDGDASNGEITVVNNALTTYTVDVGDNGNNLTQIAIIANATTDTQAAANLGVSSEQASALRQALASATAAGDTTGLDALTTAINAGGTQAQQAAQQVGVQGETLGGGSQVAFQTTSRQQGVTSNRLAGFRSGDARFVSAFAAAETGFSGGDYSAPYSAQAPRYTNAFWFQGFGGIADADGNVGLAGYDAAFGGAMIGVDGLVSDNFTIGAFGSYTHSSVDGDGAGNAQLDANTYAIGVYAGYTGESFYLDGFASYAGSDNDVSRTALGQTITATYDASQFSVGLAGGVPIEVSSNIFITPNASLTYNHYEADSYTETGSGGFSARVNPGSASQLTGTIGARFHTVYEYTSGTSFIPELRIGVIGDLVDDDAVSTATFVGGGTTFNVTGTDTDDIGALIGVGFALDNAGWTAGINYDADIRGDFMSHTARAEFRWKF
jgi:outer membrane autotransporter protein